MDNEPSRGQSGEEELRDERSPRGADTEGYSRSSGEYSTGAEEYSGSTPGYPDPADTGDTAGPTEPQAFWARPGFDSLYDYLRHFEEEQDRLARLFGEGPLVGSIQLLEGRADEPDLGLPSDELSDLATPPARQRRTRQVSVKLKPHEHELLRKAAGEYGVRPGTLARMFVVRGAQAIEERRHAENGQRREQREDLRRRLG